jgi:hypothetical protein
MCEPRANNEAQCCSIYFRLSLTAARRTWQAHFVPIIPVNTAMLDGTLEAAVSSAPPPYQQVLLMATT